MDQVHAQIIPKKSTYDFGIPAECLSSSLTSTSSTAIAASGRLTY